MTAARSWTVLHDSPSFRHYHEKRDYSQDFHTPPPLVMLSCIDGLMRTGIAP